MTEAGGAVLAAGGIDDVFSAIHLTQVTQVLPDHVSVVFDLHGDGGGTWTLSREGSEALVRREAREPNDCRLTCSVAHFRALLVGELDPVQGFVQGRLTVEGDVGLVLRLHRSVV